MTLHLLVIKANGQSLTFDIVGCLECLAKYSA